MGEYVEVAGTQTYYEVAGEGEPLVLLHGGGMTTDAWAQQLPALAERYRVYAPERSGHGRTADRPGPVSYAGMADETAGFMDKMGIAQARVVGWSDGGAVGLHLALRRPDLVSKLAVIGAHANNEGGSEAGLALISGDEESRGALRQMFFTIHSALSPDGPEHFDVVLGKWLRMWEEGPMLTLDELTAITVPVLVMQGDHDGVLVEHSAAMMRSLPQGQLAVVPATSHAVPLEKPELVNRMLLDFVGEALEQPLLFALS
jgi:pimeloyl-ACP methyl ester carboxylesterase